MPFTGRSTRRCCGQAAGEGLWEQASRNSEMIAAGGALNKKDKRTIPSIKTQSSHSISLSRFVWLSANVSAPNRL